MIYSHLFAPPKSEDFDYEPDPMGRFGLGRQVEHRAPDTTNPGWDAARADWMQEAPLTRIVGEPFQLHGSVGRNMQNRRGDVFKLQALLHREGHLDAEATGGPTGYWATATTTRSVLSRRRTGCRWTATPTRPARPSAS